MNNNDTTRTSRTDWQRLETMSDEDIDYTDIPPLDDEFFQRAKLYAPQKRAVILEPDVFRWFAEQGQEYHSLINAILRQYVNQHASGSKNLNELSRHHSKKCINTTNNSEQGV